MKKLLIGCGVFLFIFVVALGLSAGWIWNQTGGRLTKIEKRVERLNFEYPFAEETGMVIEGKQLDTWFGITTPLVEQYTVSLGRLATLADELGNNLQSGSGQQPGLLELVKNLYTTGQVMVTELVEPLEAALVKLEDAEMSMDELLWIWGQLNGTIEQVDLSKYPELQERFEQYRAQLAALKEDIGDESQEPTEIGQKIEESVRTEIEVSDEQRTALLKLLEERQEELDAFFKALDGLVKQMEVGSAKKSGNDEFGDSGFGDSGFGDSGFGDAGSPADSWGFATTDTMNLDGARRAE